MLPKVIEVFSVWQNLFAELENHRSRKILDFSGTLLAELDGPVHSEGSVISTGSLKDLYGNNLVTSLRFLIWRSAPAYPEHSTVLYQRAITSDRIRCNAYDDLIAGSGIVATVDAGLLVALAKAELLEELPKDRRTRLDREREEYFESLGRIRTEPEEKRTSGERRRLRYVSLPPSYQELDRDDIGINRYHKYYFPQSPLHEPFASLFSKRPQAALALVRDMANHATTAWRQIQDINHERMGTPIPIILDFPWGTQEFWGDWQVFRWFMRDVASNPMECAFLSLSHWSFKQIDDGRATDQIIQDIVQGTECYAILGLALALALETFHMSETTLPLVTCQRLWRHDIARCSQEFTQDADLFVHRRIDTLSRCQRACEEIS